MFGTNHFVPYREILFSLEVKMYQYNRFGSSIEKFPTVSFIWSLHYWRFYCTHQYKGKAIHYRVIGVSPIAFSIHIHTGCVFYSGISECSHGGQAVCKTSGGAVHDAVLYCCEGQGVRTALSEGIWDERRPTYFSLTPSPSY